MGPIQTEIEASLRKFFNPQHLEVVNESSLHRVPPGSETHFKVLIVSEKFEGLTRIQRQRSVTDVLKSPLANGVHALSQKTMTPSEWMASGENAVLVSPPCHGGSQSDR